jgi:hypothetical protein
VPDPSVIRPGALLVSMTGSGGNVLQAGARLAVPTAQRPNVVAFGFASGWLSGDRPSLPQDILELGDVIAGRQEPRRSPSETLVFELANPYMWDVPILAWIRAWATKQGLGTDFDFSG